MASASRGLEVGEVTLPAHLRVALFDRALTHARLRKKERDGFGGVHGGRLGLAVGKANVTTSFNAGLLLHAILACPFDLVKTVTNSKQWDGGKWLCGASYLNRLRPCVVYSIGSNFDASFEQNLQQRVRSQSGRGCDVHIYDPTLRSRRGARKLARFIDELNASGIGTLHEVGLSTDVSPHVELNGERLPAQTLEQMVASNGDHCVDVLKIDVDGAERHTLRRTSWRGLCVGMLLLEHHGGLMATDTGQPYRVSDVLEDVRILERAGFLLYSSEMVCARCWGQSELAFINVSWARSLVELGPRSRTRT